MSEEDKTVEKVKKRKPKASEGATRKKKKELPVKEEKEKEESEVKEEEPRPVSKGDFILVELTGRVAETNEIFDTTSEEEAKSSGIYSEQEKYGPRLIVVGEKWIPEGVDKRLEGLKVGEEALIEIPPGEAFGERDATNIRTVPYRLLRSKGINPSLGSQIEFEGRRATVRSVGAGRVQLDYNPPLAGRNVTYKLKIVKRFETDDEKLRVLLSRRFQGFEDKFDLKLSGKNLRVEEPEEIFFAENLQIAKRAYAIDVHKFFPGIENIEFVETIKRKGSSQ
ncbi:FKBP-type peptidyl-prolyl cis-trans isomerase [Candidatus Bathyarchaeota archaeon]|nr:FKBP-type peptidyl-prolyl cis-trans isomerase [Candidatus Bathyarchaeota archaeon]MBS7631405.1 FKBP-type peptidyl-prolyl cis-trans isomerase [Candidatus Bathyarchaeota archaeon]